MLIDLSNMRKQCTQPWLEFPIRVYDAAVPATGWKVPVSEGAWVGSSLTTDQNQADPKEEMQPQQAGDRWN